jgi:putative membrane protein
MNGAIRRPRAWTIALTCAVLGFVLDGCERDAYRSVAGDSVRFGWAAPERASALALPPAQRDFLTEAAQSGLFEIEASRIAVTRGGSAAVRRFAEATLRDRMSADTDLQQLAASVGVVLPAQLRNDLQGRLAVLEQLTGSDFDRAYARNVGVLAQEEALAAFERAADRNGERVQQFAAQQIPALRRHLEWARRLASEIERTRMA